jgi:hypothetical protein
MLKNSPSCPLRGKLGNIWLNDSSVDIGRLTDKYRTLLGVLVLKSKEFECSCDRINHLANMDLGSRAYNANFDVALRLFFH